jgi:hypothetical protein
VSALRPRWRSFRPYFPLVAEILRTRRRGGETAGTAGTRVALEVVEMSTVRWTAKIAGRPYLAFSRLRYRLLFLVLLASLPALVLIVSTAWEQRRLAASGAQDDALRLARLASSRGSRRCGSSTRGARSGP